MKISLSIYTNILFVIILPTESQMKTVHKKNTHQ